MAQRATGPAELVLLSAVARRYYLAGHSKTAISDELRLSRFQVARLLEKARSSGMVRIEIGQPGGLDLDLSSRLQDAYGLQHAVVVGAQADGAPALRAQLGAAAADLLAEVVTPQDVLGLAWARAVTEMARAVTRLPAVPVVQLTGSLSRPAHEDSSVELVRRLARTGGGPAYFFYAPMTVPDAATARALRRQPEVAGALERYAGVTRAVVGLGRWAPGASTVYDAATPAERRWLADLGVCAEFSGVFVTAEGECVGGELTERMVAVTADQLRAVPEVLALAYGEGKAPAVRAALRSGLVTSLVTHADLARAVLDAP